MQSSSKPWWITDPYYGEESVPHDLSLLAGPKGPALVKVWGEKTQEGWGLNGPRGSEGFMPRYLKNEFAERKALYAFEKKGDPFAFVMRSMKAVVVDIDGKNGGLEHAKRLGNLPRTMAETSKSGNGYHLFYSTPDDVWDDELGFAQFTDRIGIEQGVDIRAVGCVYHHATQRWNEHKIVPLPDYLADILIARQQRQAASTERIQKVRQDGDPLEILMMTDELISDLKKPIADGKRNNTLFAIGNKMKEADVDGWQTLVADRAHEVGLDADEIDKLVANISRYGG